MKKYISFDCGMKNFAYCCGSGDDKGFVIEKWVKVDLTTRKRMVVSELVSALKNHLPTATAGTVIIIEQQPRVNTAMKCMSHAIQMFYLCCGVHVVFVQPRKTHALLGISSTPSYRKRKQNAVLHTSRLLQGQDKWLRELNACDKKDDLSDCYLQAVAYHQNG